MEQPSLAAHGEGYLQMAFFLILCLAGYFRPGELMLVRAEDMIRPLIRALGFRSVLLFPEERRQASKVGEFNDTVVLYNPPEPVHRGTRRPAGRPALELWLPVVHAGVWPRGAGAAA